MQYFDDYNPAINPQFWIEQWVNVYDILMANNSRRKRNVPFEQTEYLKYIIRLMFRKQRVYKVLLKTLLDNKQLAKKNGVIDV